MTGNTKTRKPTREERRAQRYAARSVLWDKSSLPRVRSCGLRSTGGGDRQGRTGTVDRSDARVGVVVTHSPDGSRHAGFSGVQSCGSVWACPVCSEKIQAHRQAEITRALDVAAARGWVVGFLTFTVRHRKRHALAQVMAAASTGWRAATSGSRSAWQADRDDFGVAGYVRLLETTHGGNGWHVHFHALVFLDPAASARAALNDDGTLHLRDVEDLGASMYDRFRASLDGTPFKPAARRKGRPCVGYDARLVTDRRLGDYFAKGVYAVKSHGSTAHDVTSSASKTAKRSSDGTVSRTPFGILADLVADPTPGDLALWLIWEAVSKGKRQLLWSNGLRSALGLDVEEESDQSVAEQTAGGSLVVEMYPAAYRRLAFAGLLPAVLVAAERDDNGSALFELLHERGIPWWLPDDPASPAARDSA